MKNINGLKSLKQSFDELQNMPPYVRLKHTINFMNLLQNKHKDLIKKIYLAEKWKTKIKGKDVELEFVCVVFLRHNSGLMEFKYQTTKNEFESIFKMYGTVNMQSQFLKFNKFIYTVDKISFLKRFQKSDDTISQDGLKIFIEPSYGKFTNNLVDKEQYKILENIRNNILQLKEMEKEFVNR